MNWLKKAILCAAAGVAGASANAQEPAVRLGPPTRLTESAAQQIGVDVPPPPRVVRAARATVDDDKRLYLPRELPAAADDSKLLWPAETPRKFERIAQPAAGDRNNTPAGKTDAKAPPAIKIDSIRSPMSKTEPNNSDRNIVVASSSPAPLYVSKETIIICDDKGNPIPQYADGGPNRIYASGEWLYWWTRGFRVPPLVTTASPTDPERTRGALGSGTTRILYGDETTSQGPVSGARFTLGYNLDPCGICAVEGSFFFLTRKNDNHVFTNDVLARPFFNINEGHEDRELTASPGINPGDVVKAAGTIRIDTSSTFLGAEANLRTLCWCSDGFLLTGLAGFRYLYLSENLSVTENINVLKDIPATPGTVPIFAGDQISVFDQFATRNRFYGGQVGATAEWQRGRWNLQTTGKFALGATTQSIDIDGGQQITSAHGNRQFNGGLLALPSNIGNHSQTRLSYVPEINFKLGYNLTDNLRVFVGYDFLFWSSVLRPGDQIDRALDLNQVPNSGGTFPTASQVRPIVPFQTSSFWAQGVSAGILLRY
jgi:Putative beta barrel porin-7 (BBP7)